MKPRRIQELHDLADLPGQLGWSEDDRLKCKGCGEFAAPNSAVCTFCYAQLGRPGDRSRALNTAKPPPSITTWEVMMTLAVIGFLSWLLRVDVALAAEAALSLLPWLAGTSIMLRTGRDPGGRRTLSARQGVLRTLSLLAFPLMLGLLALCDAPADPAFGGLQVILALVGAAGSGSLMLLERLP